MTKLIKNIFEEVKKQGIEYSTHCSDLYIPVNDQTRKLVDYYEYKGNVEIFISQIDGKPWYDIPFAYSEYKKF